VNSGHFRKRVARLCLFLTVVLLVAGALALVAHAGLRGPGKYSGVVVFDRWDTCFLLSGPYITYISESVKNELRAYAGKAMQVDASDIFQPLNPGDALIRKYKIIGPAPVVDHAPILDGLELIAEADFNANKAPAFFLTFRNIGSTPLEIFNREVGPAVLGRNEDTVFSPSDGGSVALVTRVDLASAALGKYEWLQNQWKYSLSYYEHSNGALLERFVLQPGQSKKARLALRLLDGQYQFIVGYGGGVHEAKSLASNAISFDVNGETATVVNPDTGSAP